MAPAFASFNRGAEIGIVSKSLTYIYTVFVMIMMFIFTWLFLNSCFRCADLRFFFSWIFGLMIKIVHNFETHSENTLDSAVEECIRSPCAVSVQVKGFQLLPVQQNEKVVWPCDDQICCWVSWLLKKSHQGWWLKSPTTKTTATVTPGKLTAFRYLFLFKFTWDMCSSLEGNQLIRRRLTSTYL